MSSQPCARTTWEVLGSAERLERTLVRAQVTQVDQPVLQVDLCGQDGDRPLLCRAVAGVVLLSGGGRHHAQVLLGVIRALQQPRVGFAMDP
eukprot:4476395-Prymnesium_polylepis.1